MITLHTAQLKHWRRINSQGLYLLDTTVKTGIKAFAPTWDMVMGVKKGEITEAQYTERYRDRMSTSRIVYQDVWAEYTDRDNLVITCYCPHDQFCHRHLFLDIYARYLEEEGIECICGGELYV